MPGGIENAAETGIRFVQTLSFCLEVCYNRAGLSNS